MERILKASPEWAMTAIGGYGKDAESAGTKKKAVVCGKVRGAVGELFLWKADKRGVSGRAERG